MNYQRRLGFTLSETLITILIIGIIAAVTLPVVMKTKTDKIGAMKRKSYYILETTLAQIKSDDSMYRDKIDGSAYGFMNTEKVTVNGKTYEGKTKFCELFANSLTKRDSGLNCSAGGQKTFTSADNVDWYLPVTDFSDGYAEVKFDVNGKAEPNCMYDAKTCKEPDTFKYYVTASGQIYEKLPKIDKISFCIHTNITGEGEVSPSKDYCGLSNGTYVLTANPKAGWQSSWPNNQKKVKIKNNDVTTNLTFTESPKACIKLNVNCEAGAPNNCGIYRIDKGAFATNGNQYIACNLPDDSYKISVLPFTNYDADWLIKTVQLNGVDQTIDVTLSQKRYCANLNVTCPDGAANNCGSYNVMGGGNTYGMDISGSLAKVCSLKNGSYNLRVSANSLYTPDKNSMSVTISNGDWNGNVSFSKKNFHNCKGSITLSNGHVFSCPYNPPAMTKEECNLKKEELGIKACYFSEDYWAGAVNECGSVDKLPTLSDLKTIVSDVYWNHPVENTDISFKNGLTFSSTMSAEKGFPSEPFWIWSQEEDNGKYSYYRGFSTYFTGTLNATGDNDNRSAKSMYVMCRIK